MPIDYTQLANEINSDPRGLGYAQFVATGSDSAIADLLNRLTGGGTGPVPVDILPSYTIFEAIDPAEWAALTAQEKQRIQTILGMGAVNVRGTNTRAAFNSSFGPGTTTRANVVALLNRTGSRAEVLFGGGTIINANDVARALGRG